MTAGPEYLRGSRTDSLVGNLMIKTLLASLAGLAMTLTASAAPVLKPSERPAGWQTWTWNDTCFAMLYPKEETVGAIDSEGAYLAVKHLPAEKNFDSVAIVSGQGPDKRMQGRIDIDGNIYNMLTFAGAGFVSTGPREEALLEALSKGKEARVTWTSDEGMIVQTYTLAGMTEAKKIIDFACKPKDEKAS